MEEEKKSATDVMRDLLKGDHTLLARREELANAVQQSALPRKEKLALTKALTTTTICDLFAAADQGTDEDRATVVARATEALAGTKDAEAIAQTLYDAMDWASEAAGGTADTSDTDDADDADDAADEPAAAPLPSEPPAAPAKETEAPQTPWDCVCGQKANTGKFCVACGRPRDHGEAKPAWTCICGQTGNTGNFCVACGRSRVEGEAPAASANAQAPSSAASVAHTTPADDDATQVLPRVEAPAPEPQPVPQPAPQPTYQARQEPTAKEKAGNQSKALIAVIAILVIAIGVFVYKETASDTSSSSYSSLAKQSSSSSSSAAKEREMKSDLSLGGLDLDMEIGDVRKALGQEKSSEQRDKFNFLLYDNIEVGTYRNVVRALVSNGPSVKTKRGIHEGSTLADVQKAYGTDCASMDYDDLMLYEYSFKSMSGNDGLLRFAIKKSDNTVKYISVRIPEDEKPAANNDADANAAAQALNDYYQGITHNNGRNSYNILSADMQQHMGTYDQFISGYQTTLSHNLSDLTLVSQEGTQVTISYTLTARDRTNTSRVKVQTFHCEATLSKATGSWHIVNMSAKKQSERME